MYVDWQNATQRYSKPKFLQRLQLSDQNFSHSRVSGRIVSYRPKKMWPTFDRLEAVNFKALLLWRHSAFSFFPAFSALPLSVGDGKSHVNVIGVGSGAGKSTNRRTLTLLNLAYVQCGTVNSWMTLVADSLGEGTLVNQSTVADLIGVSYSSLLWEKEKSVEVFVAIWPVLW